ncbi:DUF305 domain-containing protein [Sinomonas mesophila]|uniref:DUF305 domain-containing protein n=1 Tax=Sinomonas mesophila TaxID=1531955 RepID=UPI00318420AA
MSRPWRCPTLLGKTGVDERVTALAQKIKDAQQPEIETLRSWLSAWGQPAAAPAGHSMEGMMSQDDMDKLHSLDGSAAAQLFLTQMIAHHEGAISMAETEAGQGKNPEAVALAKSIADSQSAEITEMKSLLSAL